MNPSKQSQFDFFIIILELNDIFYCNVNKPREDNSSSSRFLINNTAETATKLAGINVSSHLLAQFEESFSVYMKS